MSAEKVRVEIQPTDRDFAYWITHATDNPALRERLARASVLLVPTEGFREYAGPLFPVATEDFLRHLEDRLPKEQPVDIAVDDGKYQELALHSIALVIVGAIVTGLVAPIYVAVAAEYIKRKLWPPEPNREVRLSLTVQQPAGSEPASYTITYEGPAHLMEGTMQNALKRIPSVEVPQDLPPAGGMGARRDNEHQ